MHDLISLYKQAKIRNKASILYNQGDNKLIFCIQNNKENKMRNIAITTTKKIKEKNIIK